MPQPKRPWSRADYDLLEARLTSGHRYADIAAEMGRSVISCRGTAQRIGLATSDNQHWRQRRDWPEIDALITDCIEARLMTIPQVAGYLKAIGRPVSAGALYRRLADYSPSVRNRARKNGARRQAAVCSRIRRKSAA